MSPTGRFAARVHFALWIVLVVWVAAIVAPSVQPGHPFGIYHGDIWRFIPTAALGFALSAIALAADSIVPAMIAHFANNACIRR